MNNVVKVGGKDITIRALTWGEKKKLKTEGKNISKLDPGEDNDEFVEQVVEIITGDKSFLDVLSVHEVYELFGKITQLSFLGEIESKNSDGPPPSP